MRAIIDRDRKKVLHVILTALGSASDTEDIAQDVFIRTWQRLQQGHTIEDTPSAWVMRVTINCIRDKMRTAWNRRVILQPEDTRTGAVPSAEQEALDRTPSLVVAAIHQLPANQRDVVLLFYVADQSIQAISVALGLPENTVKSRLHRGRQRLARVLEGTKEVNA